MQAISKCKRSRNASDLETQAISTCKRSRNASDLEMQAISKNNISLAQTNRTITIAHVPVFLYDTCADSIGTAT